MLWRLTEHYRESKSREWIRNVIPILQDIKNKIIAMYCDIRRLNGNSRLVGFSSSIPLVDIFDRIGCKPLFTILDNYSSKIDSDDEFAVSTATADKWNMSNYRMLARFLSYCRILSFQKTAALEPGAIRIRSRIDPLYAASMTEKQLDDLNLIDDNLLSNFIASDDRPTPTALIREIKNMQVYISQLTCDWLIQLSLEMGLGESIQK
jgi:hypothetical protein